MNSANLISFLKVSMKRTISVFCSSRGNDLMFLLYMLLCSYIVLDLHNFCKVSDTSSINIYLWSKWKYLCFNLVDDVKFFTLYVFQNLALLLCGSFFWFSVLMTSQVCKLNPGSEDCFYWKPEASLSIFCYSGTGRDEALSSPKCDWSQDWRCNDYGG